MEKKDTSEIVLKRHGSISPQPVCEERRSGMMKVDINTKMITLLGLPLTQSFAARMQNKGYEALGSIWSTFIRKRIMSIWEIL